MNNKIRNIKATRGPLLFWNHDHVTVQIRQTRLALLCKDQLIWDIRLWAPAYVLCSHYEWKIGMEQQLQLHMDIKI